jgi:Na+-transporting methylmalonyl-CoA/oxaloacetate decarboxylase beta subunit
VQQPGLVSRQKVSHHFLNLFTVDTLILSLVPFVVSTIGSIEMHFLPPLLSQKTLNGDI